ncbi:MAG: crossover junction endodeoxyribonuclease RuvC [Gammaproteobacteria bacterium]|nr:crossover junction endodeoxyribonuclease RuvC [Gammaproteobacteria bacterium]
MTRILGIDPGSRTTGYGIIDFQRDRATHVASGCVDLGGETCQRLRIIFDAISELVTAYGPREVAAEQIFVHRNAASALKLGQARGAALLAGALRDLPVYEYTATQIKQAVTGRGHGAKGQVQHMIRVLLALSEAPRADAADALAVALCHAHMRWTLTRIQRLERPGGRGVRP